MNDALFPTKGTPEWDELVLNVAKAHKYGELTILIDQEESKGWEEIYAAAIKIHIDSANIRNDLGLE